MCSLTLLIAVIGLSARCEAFSQRWTETFNANDIFPCAHKSKILHEASNDGDLDWTYFTLSMSWPKPLFDARPSYDPGEGPESCDKKAVFDSSKVALIADDLNKYWPNLLVKNHISVSAYNIRLIHLCHEWCTHGTCATEVSYTRNEYYYFKQTIDLFKEYNPYSALSKYGITPSNTMYYTAENITIAIEKEFLVTPTLVCYHKQGDGSDQVYLHEIHMCLNKAMNTENCSTEKLNASYSCDGKIIYPPITHSDKKAGFQIHQFLTKSTVCSNASIW
ncbi:hypothetical protein BSL78_07704 [Apostichopus japonicus]|uniref:Uncharacterized protein n=1 Tax=Stichopus japonicus TaxID=307972 RepID=A0A2G8L572_STIJA|nr:hypothetical protein BSL78_07704 [Apostichopus japonicus]